MRPGVQVVSFFSKFRSGTQLAWAFALIEVLFACLMGVALWHLEDMYRSVQLVEQHTFLSAPAILDLEAARTSYHHAIIWIGLGAAAVFGLMAPLGVFLVRAKQSAS